MNRQKQRAVMSDIDLYNNAATRYNTRKGHRSTIEQFEAK